MEGKVVFITGAASGIGAACAFEFAKLGAKLILTDRNSLDNTRKACLDFGAAEQNVFCVSGDLTKEEDIVHIVNKGIEEFGTVDIVVNVAGIVRRGGYATPLPDLDIQYQIMFRAMFSICQKLTPYVKKQKGKIVNISSGVSKSPMCGMTAYACVKAAIDHFTRCLALELAPHGVTVNTINPGLIETPLHWSLANIKTEEEAKLYFKRVASILPLRYNGQPEEVAAAVVYLTSEKAKFITGESLLMDGGLMLKTGNTGF